MDYPTRSGTPGARSRARFPVCHLGPRFEWAVNRRVDRRVELSPMSPRSAHSIGRVASPVGSRPARSHPTMVATTGMAITMMNRLLQGT
jgi:hypothetical protein